MSDENSSSAASPASSPATTPKKSPKVPKAKKAAAVDQSADQAPVVSSPESVRNKKRKRDAEDGQVNKTLDTQFDTSKPGVAASNGPTLGNYLRFSEEDKRVINETIQKPKSVRIEDWQKVSVGSRALWVIHHRNKAEKKVPETLASFESFLSAAKEEQNRLDKLAANQEIKLSEQKRKYGEKLATKARGADRRVKELYSRAALILAGKDIESKQTEDEELLDASKESADSSSTVASDSQENLIDATAVATATIPPPPPAPQATKTTPKFVRRGAKAPAAVTQSTN